jgi:hypothetical protein
MSTDLQQSAQPLDEPDRLRRLITRSATPFAVALILGLAGPVSAELAAEPNLPQFSKADIERIQRNASLRELHRVNPWLTYRVLRTIDEQSATRQEVIPDDRHPRKPAPFDEKRDPDLGQFQRVAPEAAVDLFALIKKASGRTSQ